MNIHLMVIQGLFFVNFILAALVFLIYISIRIIIGRYWKRSSAIKTLCAKSLKFIALSFLCLTVIEILLSSVVSQFQIAGLVDDLKSSDSIKIIAHHEDEFGKEVSKEFWVKDTEMLSSCLSTFKESNPKLFLLPIGVGFNTIELTEFYLFENEKQLRTFCIIGDVLVLEKGIIFYETSDLHSEIRGVFKISETGIE